MSEGLPLLLDAEEAIEYLKSDERNDAEKAYAIGIMSRDGFSNKEIREALGIKRVYTATHYIRAGTRLSEEELSLWHENIVACRKKKRLTDLRLGRTHHLITLGHIRTILGLRKKDRITLLERIETEDGKKARKPITIEELKKLMKGFELEKENESDMRSFEIDFEEKTNREIKVRYNQETEMGTIQIAFYKLSDLENICGFFGYKNPSEEEDF